MRILSSEAFLAKNKLWNESVREKVVAEANEEVNEAAKVAQATPRPGLETIFGDVYADGPAHIRRQGEFLFDLSRRRGEAALKGSRLERAASAGRGIRN